MSADPDVDKRIRARLEGRARHLEPSRTGTEVLPGIRSRARRRALWRRVGRSFAATAAATAAVIAAVALWPYADGGGAVRTGEPADRPSSSTTTEQPDDTVAPGAAERAVCRPAAVAAAMMLPDEFGPPEVGQFGSGDDDLESSDAEPAPECTFTAGSRSDHGRHLTFGQGTSPFGPLTEPDVLSNGVRRGEIHEGIGAEVDMGGAVVHIVAFGVNPAEFDEMLATLPPAIDVNDFTAGCLIERGFRVERSGEADGRMNAGVGLTDQRDSAVRAMDECIAVAHSAASGD